MKLIHLADLHIGKRLCNYSLIEDQRYVFEKIIEETGKFDPDAILIAGDVFDRSTPSEEAITLYDSFISALAAFAPIYMISGNHDSGVRLELFKDLLARGSIHVLGTPEEVMRPQVLEVGDERVHIYMLPYLSMHKAREIFGREISSADEAIEYALSSIELDESAINILITHQFYTDKQSDRETLPEGSELTIVGGLDDIRASHLSRFDYVAMGHIHRMCEVRNERIRYAGSPLKYSVNESDKYLNTVELTKDTIRVTPVALPAIRDVREIRGSFSELARPEMATEDYVSLRLVSESGVSGIKKRLLEFYPNLLNIIYEHEDIEETEMTIDRHAIAERPVELLESFYALRGFSLEKPQREFAEHILEELNETD